MAGSGVTATTRQRLIAEARGNHVECRCLGDSPGISGLESCGNCEACGEGWPCLVERLCRELDRAQ